MKLRLYLDTSVITAHFDARRPERQAETQTFWRQLPQFEVSISDLTAVELQETADARLRKEMEEIVRPFSVIHLNAEMHELARYYLEQGIFPLAVLNDALHVACAVVSRQDVLVSWNFRHLVNRRRRTMINEANAMRRYPTIEIVAPPEV